MKDINQRTENIFASFGINIHLLKVFFVILAFIKGLILFFLATKIKFGQISESTKKIIFGFHKSKTFN